MKINKIALALCSLVFSSNLIAAPYVTAEAGIYGGGSNTNNAFENVFDNSDEIKATGRLSVGYLWPTWEKLKLGLEVGIHGYQHIKTDDTTFDIDDTTFHYKRTSGDLLGVLDYSFLPCVNGFLKAGAAYVHQRSEAELDGVGEASFHHKQGVPKAAAGVGYTPNPMMNISLAVYHEFEKDRGYEGIDSVPSATSVMLGITYNIL